MSILNLSGPRGRQPRSPRALRIWIGIGVIAAVVGVGSTLAANISINGGTSAEFGQGVERTVYCGGDYPITVTPISAFDPTPTPTYSAAPRPTGASAPVVASGPTVIEHSHRGHGEDLPTLIINGDVAVRTSASTSIVSIPFVVYIEEHHGISSVTVTSSPSIELSYSGTTSPVVVSGAFVRGTAYTFTVRVTNSDGTSSPAVSGPVTPYPTSSDSISSELGSFYLSGIQVSDIPDACAGKNFVVQVYDNIGTLTPIEVNGSLQGGVMNVYWTDSPVGTLGGWGALLSSSRESYLSDADVALEPSSTHLESGGAFNLKLKSATRIAATAVGQITIESQNDTFGEEEVTNGGILI